MAEANTAERVSVEAVEIKVKDYKARSPQSAHSAISASIVEEAMIAGVNADVKEKIALDKRYEKMYQAMETLSKSLTAVSVLSAARFVIFHFSLNFFHINTLSRICFRHESYSERLL